MTDTLPPGFPWAAQFLRELASRATVKAAAGATGISVGTAYYLRHRNPAFAAAWEQALRPQPHRLCRPGRAWAEAAARPAPATSPANGPATDPETGLVTDRTGTVPRTDSGWRSRFLEALAETSNVSASAQCAGIPAATAYKTRRADTAFAARWRKALHEGYDNLEMELLGHLRDPVQNQKMDVASALRLLAAHRETVARERALVDDEDEQEVLDSIDRFIDDMRRRRAANDALPDPESTPGHAGE